MLTLDVCMEIAKPYLDSYIIDEIWENQEAYFFDGIFGKWEDNSGIVVYKEDGKTMFLYDYFNHTKVQGILKNFWLYEHPHEEQLPEGWDEEDGIL